ncbi:MAG TPA: PEGA domain-containing protein [Polyangia bacterium]|nr:PEGA domain-containing protein [Polyangia bacterium]
MSTGAPVVHVGGPTEEALFAFRAGRLLPEAAGWIGDHVDGCQRCRRAMHRIDALHEALEPPAERPFVRQADITAVRRRLERRRPAWSKIGLATCACAVASFALMLTLKHPGRAGHEELATSGGENVGFAIAARQGVADVELGDDHAVAEATMGVPTRGWLTVAPKGRVVAMWGGARVAVEGGATGARVQLSTSLTKLRQLTLERGTVLLDVDPLAAGAELIVATNDARVSVHGTRFFVDSSAAGTQVACDRGRVRVAVAGRVIEVPAGTQLTAGATAPSVLTAESGLRLSALDMTLAVSNVGPTESLDVFADVADATVAVDGVDYGRAPLSLAVAPGNHAVRVSAAGHLPVEERVAVVAGSPTLFRAEMLALSLDEPAAAERAEHAAPQGETPRADANQAARDALARARAEVLAGAYDRAISRLQSLRAGKAPRVQLDRAALLQAQAERLAHRPERALPLLIGVARSDGPEAEQAQFLLAQTFGRDMGDPLRAAVAYGESERRFAHGIFAEEAAFRRGESLLSGGDTRAGLEALEDYLRRFPSAPHADDAHLFLAGARRDRLGDCAGAVPHLQAVAAGHGPRAPQALIGAARCLHSLGRQAEANSAYERYLQVQPHGRYADEARLGATGSARLTK